MHAPTPTRQARETYGACTTQRTAQHEFDLDIVLEDESLPRDINRTGHRQTPGRRHVRQYPGLSVSDGDYHLERFNNDDKKSQNDREVLSMMKRVSCKMTQIDIRLNANEKVSKNIGQRLKQS